MNALELLQTRVSRPILKEPAPDRSELEIIFNAALRAPDHARLRPWRFITIEGDQRTRLGELFIAAIKQATPDADDRTLGKAITKPLRAPMIIVVVASLQPHPKVPEIEQIISAGCAAQNILLAAHALGFGAMWRTGGMAYDPVVKRGLGLGGNERIIGFIYVGSTSGSERKIASLPIEDFVTSGF